MKPSLFATYRHASQFSNHFPLYLYNVIYINVNVCQQQRLHVGHLCSATDAVDTNRAQVTHIQVQTYVRVACKLTPHTYVRVCM